MKTTTSRTIILCLFLAIFGGLAGYYTYDNVTKCNDYYRDIPSTVISVNYTNITQYDIMYCNECQNGGSFPPCNVLISTNKTGSCHINKKMNCIDDGEFTWIDENGRLHYENYDGHNKYNSLSHCYVDEFQLYRFIIGVDYQLNNENRTGHFGINCNQPSTSEKCYDDVIEYYAVGNSVTINVKKNDGSIRLMLNCQYSSIFIILWAFTAIMFCLLCCTENVNLRYISGTEPYDYDQYI
jgi:hypothetical protein